MNLPTHILFGALIGALFFGRWDIILLVAVGSVLPDMDREYGFFSKDYFPRTPAPSSTMPQLRFHWDSCGD